METATITIKGVETKEGASDKGPWKMYKVAAADGSSYSTFDAAMGSQAAAAIGQVASISYETNAKGYHNLKTLTVTGQTAPPPAPPAKTPTGEADWDLIGLRKTRCALWAAGIGAGLSAQEIRGLVVAAEADIFHRAPAQPLDEVPF